LVFPKISITFAIELKNKAKMEDYKKLYEETQSKMKAFIKRWDGIKLSSNDLFTEELKQIVETENEPYDSVDSEICTSIKQSKKLRELGIDTSTADMFWDTLLAKKPKAQVDNSHFIDEYDDKHRVPAWSLTALLKIIPYKINDNISNCVLLISKRGNGYSISYVREGNHYCAICGIFKYNIIEAAFEMVCWLKENKKI
jgi:hypothetical protein